MSLLRIGALAGRIIRQFTRDRRTMALLFIVPLLIMTILNFVLGSSSAKVNLGVVPPAGPIGKALVAKLQEQTGAQSQLAISIISAGQVESKLKSGNLDGALIFPADFVTSLQQGQTPDVTLRLEGSSPATAMELRANVSLLLGTLSTVSGGAPAASQAQPTLITSYLYGGPQYTATDALAPLFIGLFSFFFVFLLTSVAFLRERSQGTIERVLVAPMTRTELVIGYVLGFAVFAILQSLLILLYVILVLRVHYAGNPVNLFLVTGLLTIGGVNLGIFVSSFARNELQVIQFIPLLIVPQALLGGLFFPVASLPIVLKQLAYIMPLTYANFALKDVMLRGFGVDQIGGELAFLAGFALLMVLGAAFSLRQERV